MLAVVSSQDTWALIVVPLLGLGLSVLVLYGFGLSAPPPTPASPGATPPERPRWARTWRTFPPDLARSDITADVVAFAGEEDRFPWRLAPIRLVAIAATVGLGAPMGTEAPAAYLGVAAGAALGDRGRWWRRLLRPAAVGGGAAGVAALMGIPLVGTAYILELGRRRNASAQRGAGDRGTGGWSRRVANEHRPRRRPDPPGRAQGAAPFTPASSDNGVAHRGARRLDHLDHRGGDLSREGVGGQACSPTCARRAGPRRRGVDPRG